MRRWTLLAAACFFTCTAAACSSSHASTSASPANEITAETALGDSVPYGTACECTPYPQLTGDDISHAVGHAVAVSNDSVAGYTSDDVVRQVDIDRAVMDHIKNSEVVLVEIGANDVAHTASCGTTVSCYEPALPHFEHNLNKIVQRVEASRKGQGLHEVLLDYWSVWLGGQYAQEQGNAYVDAAETLTTRVNDIVRSTAHATGSLYVDLRTAFRGPDDAWDETHLLAPDGDHPNAEGHARIAEAIATAVRQARA